MSPSDILAGRYAIEQLAASGGMATLYRARDVVSQAMVAIKVLRGYDAEAERSTARFLREAKTLRSLRHPAIVRYLDHGVDARVGPFLVMEWLDGEPLDLVLRERGLRPEEALVLTRRIALALAYVHGEGIVHRDVKPSNIILPGGRTEGAVLVDFGIAIDAENGTRATQTGMVLGTPRYMAPEQLRSARGVDGRADVFGLGCCLYESVTGRHPFGGSDVYSYAARVAAGEAPAASAVRPALPEAVSRVVGRMIAREAARRSPASAPLLAEIDAAIRALEGLALEPVALPPPGDDEELAPSPLSTGTLPTYGEVAFVAARTPVEPEVRGPRPAGRFVGRIRERAELVARLAAPGAVGVVWGAPGIGKSRLALEVCHELVRGVGARPGRTGFIVALRGASDRGDVLRAVLAVLGTGMPSGGLDADVPRVGRMLRAWGDPVVVFDGADRVLGDVAEIASAWSGLRVGATVMITARSPARVEGGVEIEVGPLPATLETGGPGPGVELLLLAAGAVEEALDESQRRAAIRVVEALDGNPLALELAAARVPVLGLAGLAERLDRPLALLGATSGSGALSMSDALQWSFDLLAPREQRALAECAVFRGPFSARAAEAVLTTDPEVSTVDVLVALRRSSLVSEARGASEVRLVQARTVREFARGKLPSEEAAAVERRRNAYFASWAWGLAGEIARTGNAGALARLAEDAEQVLDVVESTLGATLPSEEEARIGLRAAVALEPVVAMRGPVGRYLELLDRGLSVIAGREELIGHARRVRGSFLGKRGAPGPARADLEEACAIGAECGARELEAEARLALGALHQWSQELEAAARMYHAVLDAPGEGRSLRAEARAFTNLATLEHDARRLDAAKALYEDAISLLETLADERMTALAQMNLAVLLQERGERAAARVHYTQAAEALAKPGDDRLLAGTLGNLGMLEFEEKNLDAALAHLEKARSLLARTGDLRSEALAVGRLAGVLSMQGRTEDALRAAVLAERMAARHDAAVRGTVRLLRAFVDVAQARAASRRGDHALAESSLLAARARIRDATTPTGGSTAVAALSDDARTALRVLEAWMSTASNSVD
jgi:tetratricopeptide (TPR) repeat protein/tRNA A-37 threonylcarbamoyl transferase component Bud32